MCSSSGSGASVDSSHVGVSSGDVLGVSGVRGDEIQVGVEGWMPSVCADWVEGELWLVGSPCFAQFWTLTISL